MLIDSRIVRTKHVQAFEKEFCSTDRLEQDVCFDPEQALNTDTASKIRSLEISPSRSWEDGTDAIRDNNHNDNANLDAGVLPYTPVDAVTDGEGESKNDYDDDRKKDRDNGFEDIYVRPHGLCNIPRAQYSSAVLLKAIATCDETTLSMALKSLERIYLVNAIRDGLVTLANLGTWNDSSELPRNLSAVPFRFLSRLKRNEDGFPARFEARLNARGNLQEKECGHGALYSPVACIETVLILLAISAFIEWATDHLDIKGSFLSALLPETDWIYILLPSVSGVPAAAVEPVRIVKSLNVL